VAGRSPSGRDCCGNCGEDVVLYHSGSSVSRCLILPPTPPQNSLHRRAAPIYSRRRQAVDSGTILPRTDSLAGSKSDNFAFERLVVRRPTRSTSGAISLPRPWHCEFCGGGTGGKVTNRLHDGGSDAAGRRRRRLFEGEGEG